MIEEIAAGRKLIEEQNCQREPLVFLGKNLLSSGAAQVHLGDQYEAFRGKTVVIDLNTNARNVYMDQLTEEDYIMKLIVENLAVLKTMMANISAGAYAKRILPVFKRLVSGLEVGDNIQYDRSDALEIVTSPCRELGDVRRDLMAMYDKIRPELEELGLKLFFGARLPDAKPTGWKETLGRGEPQNMLGLHVHFGRVRDEFEAAVAYDAFRCCAPVIIALTANSGIAAGENSGYMSARQALYRNMLPPRIGVKLNMSDEEKAELRQRMRGIFGENSKVEQGAQYSIESEIHRLLAQNGIGAVDDQPRDTMSSRGYSAVYLRPELGTVEVRMIDGQTDYDNGSFVDGHVEANLCAVDLVDAIGKAAVEAYRNGKTLFDNVEDLDEKFEMAIQLGLADEGLRRDASKLLSMISPYLSEKSSGVLERRIDLEKSPAALQIEVFVQGGIDAVFAASTV